MNLFEEAHDIAALAKKIERSDEDRSYEDEAYSPRERARVLKRNNIYSEADLEKFNDDQKQAEAINRDNRSVY